MKNALFYTPLAGSVPHFETDLELIKTYLNMDYRVTILSCQGNLPTCELNPSHRFPPCYRCRSRFTSGMNWVGKDKVLTENFVKLSPDEERHLSLLEELEITSIEQLKEFEIDDVDIGMAALSSLISKIREPYPNVQVYQNLIKKNLIAAAKVYYSVRRHLVEKEPDVFLLYNGRYAALRPALRAAQTLGIQTYVHEVTGRIDRYGLTPNAYPHDRKVIMQEIERNFTESPLSYDEKQRIAFSWFEERINQQDQGFGVFTKHQKAGFLPSTLSDNSINVAIFNSSEDEFEAIKEYENPLYRNQDEGFKKIFNSFSDASEIRFFLRIHPNLRGIDNSQTRSLKQLHGKYENLEIIEPESPVNTYDLIRKSDLVITFGSTVGIEAAYLNKPSILLGRAFYEDLGACIRPENHDELVGLLKSYIYSGSVPELGYRELAVVKYGFFYKSYGNPYVYAKKHDLFRAYFEKSGREIQIKASFPARLLAKLDHVIWNQ